MQKKYFICCLLVLLSTQNHAVLIEAETWTLENRTIILFSEEHKSNISADTAQFKTFEQLLLNRGKDAPLLHVLVERPIWKSILPANCTRQSVAANIVDRFESCPLQRTAVVNAEIRFLSYIACHLLNIESNPMELNPHTTWNMSDRTCTSSNLRLSDLQEEFATNMEQIKQEKENIMPIWQRDVLNNAIARALNKYQELETLTHNYKLDTNASILSLSRNLYLKMQDPDTLIAQNAQRQKIDLSNAILDAFARLLDASLLTRTFQIAEGNVAIIAGYHHIARIRQLLTRYLKATSSFGGISIDPAQQKTLTPAQIANTLSTRKPHNWIQAFCTCPTLNLF